MCFCYFPFVPTHEPVFSVDALFSRASLTWAEVTLNPDFARNKDHLVRSPGAVDDGLEQRSPVLTHLWSQFVNHAEADAPANGCAVQIALLVEDQACVRYRPVRTAGKGVEHGMGA